MSNRKSKSSASDGADVLNLVEKIGEYKNELEGVDKEGE